MGDWTLNYTHLRNISQDLKFGFSQLLVEEILILSVANNGFQFKAPGAAFAGYSIGVKRIPLTVCSLSVARNPNA